MPFFNAAVLNGWRDIRELINPYLPGHKLDASLAMPFSDEGGRKERAFFVCVLLACLHATNDVTTLHTHAVLPRLLKIDRPIYRSIIRLVSTK